MVEPILGYYSTAFAGKNVEALIDYAGGSNEAFELGSSVLRGVGAGGNLMLSLYMGKRRRINIFFQGKYFQSSKPHNVYYHLLQINNEVQMNNLVQIAHVNMGVIYRYSNKY